MSQENIEAVRRVYDGWTQGDFSENDSFDPEVEFAMVDWPEGSNAHGRDAMWRSWRSALSAWEGFRPPRRLPLRRGSGSPRSGGEGPIPCMKPV